MNIAKLIVNVIIAVCPRCNGARFMGVPGYLDSNAHRVIGELAIAGLTIADVSIAEAQQKTFCRCENEIEDAPDRILPRQSS